MMEPSSLTNHVRMANYEYCMSILLSVVDRYATFRLGAVYWPMVVSMGAVSHRP